MGEQMAIDLLTPFTKVELKAKEEKERKEQEEKKRYYNAAIQATINIIDIAI